MILFNSLIRRIKKNYMYSNSNGTGVWILSILFSLAVYSDSFMNTSNTEILLTIISQMISLMLLVYYMFWMIVRVPKVTENSYDSRPLNITVAFTVSWPIWSISYLTIGILPIPVFIFLTVVAITVWRIAYETSSGVYVNIKQY